MKKVLLSFLTAILVLPMMANNLQTMTGSYTGTLNVTLSPGTSDEMPTPPVENVKILTALEDGNETLKLNLKDFQFMGLPVGDIEVGGITVDGNGVITAPETIIDKSSVGLGMLPTQLSGTLTDQHADIVILVKWDHEGDIVPIHVTFDGIKDIAEGLGNIAGNAVKTVYAGNRLSVLNADINAYKIVNISGALVEAVQSSVQSIDLNNLPFGVYIVEINTNHGTVTRKVYRK